MKRSLALLALCLLITACEDRAATPQPQSNQAATQNGEASAVAADWPMWGRTPQRNMVAAEGQSLPADFTPGEIDFDSEQVDMTTTEKVKWIAKLGSQSYGNPTVSDGKVFLGTNNAFERNPKLTGDRSNVMAFDEETGKFLWQLSVPKLGAGKVSDWEYLGICSSPAVAGDAVFVVTNRCEVVAMDVNGMADGNDGDYQDEAKYLGVEPGQTDADILWVYDMRKELGVFPHNIASNSALVMGDHVVVATSNGVDWSHTNIPNPRAPALIVLDKNTGQLVAEEASGISNRMLHSNWSSPSYGEIDGTSMYIFGAGDGWTYGYATEPITDEDGYPILKELWRCDVNPAEYWEQDGTPIKYTRYAGPSEVIGTPVVYDDKIYVAIGQDPEHGEGLGALTCIDPTKRGDITESGIVWQHKGVHRTISTVSIQDDLLYLADYSGIVHCLDAQTGEVYWTHDTDAHIWGSTLLADGKVYIGNEDGIVTVFEHGKEKKVLATIEMGAPVYGSAIAANNTLYFMTMANLYAIESE